VAGAGEYLLQTQAGSAVGRQLITLAKTRGIRTINVVRRRETFSELKALGADEVRPASSQSLFRGLCKLLSHPSQVASFFSLCMQATGVLPFRTGAGPDKRMHDAT